MNADDALNTIRSTSVMRAIVHDRFHLGSGFNGDKV